MAAHVVKPANEDVLVADARDRPRAEVKGAVKRAPEGGGASRVEGDAEDEDASYLLTYVLLVTSAFHSDVLMLLQFPCKEFAVEWSGVWGE